MGVAILAIFHFFANDCNNDVLSIHDEYINNYKKEMGSRPPEDIGFSKTLHFQRRMLSQFYSDMAMLHYRYRIFGLSKRELKAWFTPNEVKLLGILLYMAEPAKECFIEANDVTDVPDDDIPMNHLIKRLYDEIEGVI
jgi:hypothetical protein